MRRRSFFSLLFALSAALFFVPQDFFANSWLGLAESAPPAFLSVLLTTIIDRRLSPLEYQPEGMLSHRLASSFLFVAGFIGVEIAVFYIVLTVPGWTEASRYPGSSLWEIYAASSANMQENVLHLGSHFAFSSALAAGYGIAMIALSTCPIWSGNA